MKQILIFGAGGTGIDIYKRVLKKKGVVAFSDNNPLKWGINIDELQVINPEKINDVVYDEIIVASTMDPFGIKNQLLEYGISEEKISTFFVEQFHNVRVKWLKDFAKLIKNEPGNVAEAGVFRGDFAKEINSCFSSKKLYLFDTFEGFDKRDTDECDDTSVDFLSEGHLENTSINIVLDKMPYSENCIVKKGWFPNTTEGVEDTFCFVNLDMDLYAPTLAGLEFFFPKLTPNGVILIHDYYAPFISGYIQQAIADYKKKSSVPIRLMPIGDGLSMAVLKG